MSTDLASVNLLDARHGSGEWFQAVVGEVLVRRKRCRSLSFIYDPSGLRPFLTSLDNGNPDVTARLECFNEVERAPCFYLATLSRPPVLIGSPEAGLLSHSRYGSLLHAIRVISSMFAIRCRTEVAALSSEVEEGATGANSTNGVTSG